MTLAEIKRAAGRMLVAGFDGTSLDPAVRAALAEGRLGGVILFARNVEAPRQVAALNAAVYAAASDRVPIVSVDQEGGRVQRIKAPATVVPPMALVGRARDPELAVQLGQMVGDELDAMGFNLDFAPCADVFTNPDNTVIGDRAFGTDPETVARYAGAFMLGLTTSGIVPCAKHFPGHGDTLLDSHFDLPRVEHDLDRLRRVEIAPFVKLIAARVPMIMTAHIVMPAIDPTLPITLSEAGIAGLLRQQLGFGGVVVSDDLEMKAVADRYGIEEMLHLAVRAGVDLFLVCHTREKWEEAFEVLVRMAESASVDRARIRGSEERLEALERNWLRPWNRPADVLARLGTAEHRALVDRIVARAESRGGSDSQRGWGGS